MAIRVYFLLLTLCVLFGSSFQQRKSRRKRLGYIEIMLDNLKAKTQMDIYELREAVLLLQNRSEENTPCTIDVSPLDATAITHIKSKLKYQKIEIKAVSKAISDEKTYTRDQMHETKQINHRLTQQVQELTINVLHTKHINDRLTEEVREVKTELIETKQINTELTEQLNKVESRLNKHMEANKKQILGLITEMHQKIKDIHQPSTITVPATQQKTSEPKPVTTTVPVVPHTCQNDWEQFQNKCYLLVKRPARHVGWGLANSRCTGHGAILAEPSTTEEFRFLIQITGGWEFWVGATDQETEGTWLWGSSGTPIDSSLWGHSQPDSWGGNQDCLGIDSDGWRDLTCGWEQPYICEKQATVYNKTWHFDN